MSYTEQYLKVLRKVNESSGIIHIGRRDKNYSDSDKQLLIELIGDGYANGRPQHINKEIQILEVSPTFKGRELLEELEQRLTTETEDLKPQTKEAENHIDNPKISKSKEHKSRNQWYKKPKGIIIIGVIIIIIGAFIIRALNHLFPALGL
jgi:hypothetical protein